MAPILSPAAACRTLPERPIEEARRLAQAMRQDKETGCGTTAACFNAAMEELLHLFAERLAPEPGRTACRRHAQSVGSSGSRRRGVPPACGLVLVLACMLAPAGSCAQVFPARRAVSSVDVQRLANGVLGIMSYTVAPDVTTSSLAISNAAIGNPGLTLSQLGGGFTWSKTLPLYLEGNLAYSRFDPVFVASDGAQERFVPVKWDSLSATGGIGWDFKLSEHWVMRPIFNFTLGTVASDLTIAKWWLDNNTNLDLNFLNGGRMDVYGLGGALMLDYEKFAPEADDDLELRYSNVGLRTHDTPNLSVSGHGKAENVSLWTRRRIPTGWVVWDRPVRYVFEGAYTRFLGEQKELGIDYMASLGVGIEFDSSAKDIFVSRWRALMRYKFGENVHGWALGLAVSF